MDGELSGRARRKRAKELERLMKQLDEADRREGLGAWPAQSGGRSRRAPRRTTSASRRTTWLLSGFVTILVLGIVVALHPSPQLNPVRRLFGIGDERVLAAPDVPDGNGSYEFMNTQRDGRSPVGYDPCQVIEVEINPDGAPDDYRALVETATAHTSEATGLAFKIVGTTERRPVLRRATTERRPVLVAWATDDEIDDLDGDVAGVAGSQAVTLGAGRAYYVTGAVVLDIEVFDDDRVLPEELQAIVDHEFGHLVGLDHVDDPGELMYGDNVGALTFGPGDLRGLAKIGRIPCN